MTPSTTPCRSSTTGAESAERWCSRQTTARSLDIHGAWQAYLGAAGRELESALGRAPRQFPHVTEQGRWQLLPIDTRSKGSTQRYEHGNWTAGFTLGIGWLHTAGTGEREGAERAAEWLTPLAERAHDHTTHDLGFLFYPGVALGRILGLLDEQHGQLAHTAARMLTARYNHSTGLLQAFGPIGAPPLSGTSTIDTMMNLPLLWWAHATGADPLVFDTARRHARTSARLYLRPDGSTYHLLRLDPISGAVRQRGTFQGEKSDSCWSRGQAWAVCGMAWAYAATGETELLEAADRAAGYFFDHLPEDGVPPWDFTAEHNAHIRDASASAATALGCLLLAAYHPSADDAARYREAATALLVDLTVSCLNTDSERDGLLLRSTYSLPHHTGVEGATAFGDFYFGLALACASGAIPTTKLGVRQRSTSVDG
jgi:unsaturated chondroitin disaccharide hydrolase